MHDYAQAVASSPATFLHDNYPRRQREMKKDLQRRIRELTWSRSMSYHEMVASINAEVMISYFDAMHPGTHVHSATFNAIYELREAYDTKLLRCNADLKTLSENWRVGKSLRRDEGELGKLEGVSELKDTLLCLRLPFLFWGRSGFNIPQLEPGLRELTALEDRFFVCFTGLDLEWHGELPEQRAAEDEAREERIRNELEDERRREARPHHRHQAALVTWDGVRGRFTVEE
ncbi:hypothetical protein MNV49_006694 [Pseudohyphozyma bogoriensis]|nr:hypothetical protein MNV49_006694 [Pseudohyphozyma bogoriensis]